MHQPGAVIPLNENEGQVARNPKRRADPATDSGPDQQKGRRQQNQRPVHRLRNAGFPCQRVHALAGGTGGNFLAHHVLQNFAHIRDMILPQTDAQPVVNSSILLPGKAGIGGFFRVEP